MPDFIPNMPFPSAKRSLTATELVALLSQLDGWRLSGEGAELAIEKTFDFPDYGANMAFVNALAWMAHTRNHHPEMRLGATQTTVRWRTLDGGGGISRLDLDCARRADAMLAGLAP